MKISLPFFTTMMVSTITLPQVQGQASPPQILSAYLGALDVANPQILAGVSGCPQQVGDEGMPVVFSLPIDVNSLDPSYFVVTTASQETFVPTCATLAPADDDDELHTVLLTGNLATADDLPVRVDVVGPLMSKDNNDNTSSENLQGLFIERVTIFTEGPGLVRAILLPPAESRRLGFSLRHRQEQVTQQRQIQLIWQGGVTGPLGRELSPLQLRDFTIVDQDGQAYAPMAFDDLNDGDNYVNLVVPRAVKTPVSVRVAAGTVFDPTNNPNPETSAIVEV